MVTAASIITTGVACTATTQVERNPGGGNPTGEDPSGSSGESSSSSGNNPSASSSGNAPSTPQNPTQPKPGTFPPSWNDGTSCTEPPVQTWAYDSSTTLLRQSLCTNFEGPFMVLLVGASKALLVDTGTGDANVRAAVDTALAGKNVDLVVAHSHAHGDHVGGDSQFSGRAQTTIVGHSPSAVSQAFKVSSSGSSANIGSIDLGGGRIVDVLMIPGHEASHAAFYDRETRLLLTGDTLYPGRLYVQNWNAYRASIARLVAFVDANHPVTHVVGAHIELSAAGKEYAQGVTKHPGEHVLQLAEADLRDLLATVNTLGNNPVRTPRDNYVVVPLP